MTAKDCSRRGRQNKATEIAERDGDLDPSRPERQRTIACRNNVAELLLTTTVPAADLSSRSQPAGGLLPILEWPPAFLRVAGP